MGFTVEVLEELTNIVSIDTSFFEELTIDREETTSDSAVLEIINNNYSQDIEYTKNIVDIKTENISTYANYVDIELFQTYNLEISTQTVMIDKIHYSKVEGLADFIDSRIPNAFDCGTP